MNARTNDYCAKIAADAVRVERLLPGPIERVWSYLIDPDLRKLWLAGGAIELSPGGKVAHDFHNDALSEDDDAAPPGFENAGTPFSMQGRVIECEAPKKLRYAWATDSETPSEVSFELTPRDDEVLLVVTHTKLTRKNMLDYSTGWHTHLGLLLARLEGSEAPKFWRTFAALRPLYAKRLEAS